jgi:hyperosmotically inducible periplasmic protein
MKGKGGRNLMKKIIAGPLSVLFAGLLLISPALAQTPTAEAVAENLRSDLVTLPYYGVFDHLAFRMEGRTVVLQGKVTRPSLKRAAEAVALDVRGIEEVDNQIEVLPASPMDDELRAALYRAIYGDMGLQRYGLGASPSIRIIVDRGNVSLEGIVNSEGDKARAEAQARSVGGTFQIKNNLQVD